MRVERFKEFLAGLLANSGDPAVAAVETYEVPNDERGLRDIVVRGADGISIQLRITRTSPPGGENLAGEETVVTREPGTSIVVTRESDSPS